MVDNFVACFRGRNLWWHAAAIGATVILVLSGFDWWFYTATRSPLFYWLVRIAGIGGFFVPVIVPVGLYLYGEFRRRDRLMHIAGAVAQAEMLGYLISIIYKTFTGRTQPQFFINGSVDISREFHFGFLQHGVFWGWPSSHAAVAVAGVVAFVVLVRDRKWRIIALVYAALISIGAAIGFHWFSDVIAGALLGIMIGKTVGKSYQQPGA